MLAHERTVALMSGIVHLPQAFSLELGVAYG
jgi:hypothetical protein